MRCKYFRPIAYWGKPPENGCNHPDNHKGICPYFWASDCSHSGVDAKKAKAVFEDAVGEVLEP